MWMSVKNISSDEKLAEGYVDFSSNNLSSSVKQLSSSNIPV
jgi:hypothetical protein